MEGSVSAEGKAVNRPSFCCADLWERRIHVVLIPVAVSASLLGLSASRLWKAASTEEAWDALTFSLFSLAVLLGLFTHFKEDREKGARDPRKDAFFLPNPLEEEKLDYLTISEDEEEAPAPSVTPLGTAISPDPIPTLEVPMPLPSPPPSETSKPKMVKRVRFANEIATIRIFHPMSDTETEEQQPILLEQPPPLPLPLTSAGHHRKDLTVGSNAITVYLTSPPTHKVVQLHQKLPQKQQQQRQEEDEVNLKAEAFIARFREQLRMQ